MLRYERGLRSQVKRALRQLAQDVVGAHSDGVTSSPVSRKGRLVNGNEQEDQGLSTIATPTDINNRMQEQYQRYLDKVASGDVSAPWRHFGTKHTDEIVVFMHQKRSS